MILPIAFYWIISKSKKKKDVPGVPTKTGHTLTLITPKVLTQKYSFFSEIVAKALNLTNFNFQQDTSVQIVRIVFCIEKSFLGKLQF